MMPMSARILRDETKREAKPDKHGLDFIDAVMVLDGPHRLGIESVRGGEQRLQSFAWAFGVLAVLRVVHVAREDDLRIVSFRPASEEERSDQHGWLESDFNDDRQDARSPRARRKQDRCGLGRCRDAACLGRQERGRTAADTRRDASRDRGAPEAARPPGRKRQGIDCHPVRPRHSRRLPRLRPRLADAHERARALRLARRRLRSGRQSNRAEQQHSSGKDLFRSLGRIAVGHVAMTRKSWARPS